MGAQLLDLMVDDVIDADLWLQFGHGLGVGTGQGQTLRACLQVSLKVETHKAYFIDNTVITLCLSAGHSGK